MGFVKSVGRIFRTMKARGLARTKRKLPQGVVPQYRDFFGGFNSDSEVVRQLNKRFGFDEVFYVHGSALKKGNKTVLITGPFELGKSTALRLIEKKAVVKPIEDGWIVLGKNKTGFFVLETGFNQSDMARARISKIIRKIPPIKPPRQGKKSRISENFRDRMHLVEAALSRYIASILLKNRSKEHFEPVLHKLDRVLFVTPKLEGEKVSRFTGSGAAVEEFDKFSENLRSNSVEMSEVPAKSDQFLKAMKREFGINK